VFYSNAYLKGFDLVGEVHSTLERLNKEVDETVHLGIVDDSVKQVVYIDKLDSSRVVRMFSSLGQAVPVHCTALGKAILSLLPSTALAKFLEGYNFEQFTKNTITTYDSFIQEIEQVKRQGYAVDNMEHEDTIFCIGKAFQDPKNQIAAISISIPAYRAKIHTIDSLNNKLTETVNFIKATLFNRDL
jgi:IclR family KDG regulon transcriptional repressor